MPKKHTTKIISGTTYKTIALTLAEMAEVPKAGGGWDTAYETAREDLAIRLANKFAKIDKGHFKPRAFFEGAGMAPEFIAAYEEGF